MGILPMSPTGVSPVSLLLPFLLLLLLFCGTAALGGVFVVAETRTFNIQRSTFNIERELRR